MTHFTQKNCQFIFVLGGEHNNHQILLRDFFMEEHKRPAGDVIHAYDLNIESLGIPSLVFCDISSNYALLRALAFETMYRAHGYVDLQSRAWIILDSQTMKIVATDDDYKENTEGSGITTCYSLLQKMKERNISIAQGLGVSVEVIDSQGTEPI